MISEEIVEALQAIEDINGFTVDCKYSDELHLTLISNGFDFIVKLCDVVLHTSSDDERVWSKSQSKYEDFKPYLKRRITEVITATVALQKRVLDE